MRFSLHYMQASLPNAANAGVRLGKKRSEFLNSR